MQPSRMRTIGVALIVLCTIGMAVSIPAMALRLDDREFPLVWFYEQFKAPEFTYRGEPVEIATLEDPARLEVRWRGETVTQPLEGVKVDQRLPGLMQHEDWLRVMLMVEGAQSTDELVEGFQDGSIEPRLIVAMRLPAEGYEPESWGLVRRRDWRYRFIELLPPGEPEAFAEFTGSYKELDQLADPVHRAEAGREDDLWMYHTMLQVTPPTLYRAKNKPIENAMQAMSWTWPVAGASILGLVAGCMLVGMSRVKRPPEEVPDRRASASGN